MTTDALAIILIFGGGTLITALGIIAKVITSTGKSRANLSGREAEELRERLAAVESRLDTLTKAVVGSPVISSTDAREIAEEAARLAQAEDARRAPAASQALSHGR